MGIMDGMEKGRKRRIDRGEGIILAALFFQPESDEVAHDLGQGNEQILNAFIQHACHHICCMLGLCPSWPEQSDSDKACGGSPLF